MGAGHPRPSGPGAARFDEVGGAPAIAPILIGR
jgi:hypothetical protein